MILTLNTTWSSAHFYRNPKWSDDKNRAQFGKCFTEFGHGHDYRLNVSFAAHSDVDTSILEKLRSIVFNLRETLDHQHLNFIIPEFKSEIPTTENLALYCRQKLEAALELTGLEIKIEVLRLFESPDLWVELKLTH